MPKRPIIIDNRAPRRFWRLTAYFYVLGILFFSMRPDIPGVHGSPIWVQNFKNFLHIPAYFGLTFLLLCALGRLTLKTRISAFAISVGYGAVNEVIQMSVPGRFSSLDDILRNLIGSLLAVVLVRHNPIGLALKGVKKVTKRRKGKRVSAHRPRRIRRSKV